MISGSQKSFLTETVVLSLSNDGRKVWDTVLFLIEIMHKNHTCQFFLFFPCHVCRTTTCWDPESLLPWQPGLAISPPYYKVHKKLGYTSSLKAISECNLTQHMRRLKMTYAIQSPGRGARGGGGWGEQGVQIFRLHCLAFLAPTLFSWLTPFSPFSIAKYQGLRDFSCFPPF